MQKYWFKDDKERIPEIDICKDNQEFGKGKF